MCSVRWVGVVTLLSGKCVYFVCGEERVCTLLGVWRMWSQKMNGDSKKCKKFCLPQVFDHRLSSADE